MNLNAVEINPNHRRSLTSAMQTVQRVLNEFAQLIDEESRSDQIQIDAKKAQELNKRIGAARQQLRAFCELFDIPMKRERDSLWAIQVGVASLWEILEDCKSEPMRGYGKVPEATRPVLDAEIQSLIDVLENIAAAARGEK